MTLSEELTWRGFVNQTTYRDLTALDGNPVKFYWGVDPSADSMQIGNLAAAMMVKTFIKHGHQPVLLVGGATGMIGDPDGKAQERQLLTFEQLEHNKAAIAGQYQQLFGDASFELVDNYDWFKGMNYLEFLRDVGKHVPMRQMLGREFVQTRLGDGGSGISYAEFSYVLIQAYDYLRLYQDHGVTLQVGASDQWGNCIAGVDLIRRLTGAEVHVFSSPLVVNKTTGTKFGKSETGAVWLDPAKTPPADFYQFWINVDDNSVEDYLKVFTELERPEVENIMAEFNANKAGRAAQKALAYEATKLVHAETEAQQARSAAESLAGGNASDGPELSVAAGAHLVDVLVESGLVASKTEARQLLADGGIYINDQPAAKDTLEAADFQDGQLTLRRGKKLANSCRVILQP